MSENSNFKYSGLSHETSLKVGVSQPLDTRTVVLNKTDLISNDVTRFAYYGMIVYVENEKKHYYLDGKSDGVDGEVNMTAAASNLDNWKEVGVDEDKLNTINTSINTVSANLNTLSSNLNGISSNDIHVGGSYDVYITGSDGIEIYSSSINPSENVHITNSSINVSDINASNLSVIGDYNSKAILTNGIQYYIHEYPNKDFTHADNGYTTMGQKGYYIHYIDTTGLSGDAVGSTLVFYISSNQLTEALKKDDLTIDKTFDSGYKVGDIISYNTDQAWVNFGRITDIENNKITITSGASGYFFNIRCNDSHSNPNASGNVGEWKTQLNSNGKPNGTRFTSFYVVDRPNTGACLINHVAASIG